MKSAQTPAVASQYRALIVEDDPAIRRLVEKLLVRHNVEIDTASDGRTAMKKLLEREYSVLVLDLMVPEVNGFEVIEFVKKEKVRLPIAVVSAVSQQALTRLDLDVVKLVISKPFDVDEFTRAILGLCREAHAEAKTFPGALSRYRARGHKTFTDPVHHADDFRLRSSLSQEAPCERFWLSLQL